jgi:hypothetical protein
MPAARSVEKVLGRPSAPVDGEAMAGRAVHRNDAYVVVGTPKLPADVATLVDEQRERSAAAYERLHARRWELVRRDVLEGVGAFLFANILIVRGWIDLVLIVLVGALVGCGWGLVRSAGIVSGLIAAAAQVALCLVQLSRHSGRSELDWISGLLFGSTCVALLSGFLGTRRQQRAFE